MSVDVIRLTTDPQVVARAEDMISFLSGLVPPGEHRNTIIASTAMIACRNAAVHLPPAGSVHDEQMDLMVSVCGSLIFGYAEIMRMGYQMAGIPAPSMAALRAGILSDIAGRIAEKLGADVVTTTHTPPVAPKKEAS